MADVCLEPVSFRNALYQCTNGTPEITDLHLGWCKATTNNLPFPHFHGVICRHWKQLHTICRTLWMFTNQSHAIIHGPRSLIKQFCYRHCYWWDSTLPSVQQTHNASISEVCLEPVCFWNALYKCTNGTHENRSALRLMQGYNQQYSITSYLWGQVSNRRLWYEQTHKMMQVCTGKPSELQLPVQNPAREGPCTSMSY